MGKTQQIAVLPDKYVRRYKAGETIFTRGEKATACFMIMSGQVLVHRQGEKSRLIIRVPGELLGEAAFFLSINHEEDASANKDTTLIFINQHTFLEQMMGRDQTCPHCAQPLSDMNRQRVQMAFKFCRALAQRIQALNNELDRTHVETDTVRSALESAETRAHELENERKGLLSMVSDFLQMPPLTNVTTALPEKKKK